MVQKKNMIYFLCTTIIKRFCFTSRFDRMETVTPKISDVDDNKQHERNVTYMVPFDYACEFEEDDISIDRNDPGIPSSDTVNEEDEYKEEEDEGEGDDEECEEEDAGDEEECEEEDAGDEEEYEEEDEEECEEEDEEEFDTDNEEEQMYPSLTETLMPFTNEIKRRLDSKDASLWFVFIGFLLYHLVIFYLFLFLILLLIIGKKL